MAAVTTSWSATCLPSRSLEAGSLWPWRPAELCHVAAATGSSRCGSTWQHRAATLPPCSCTLRGGRGDPGGSQLESAAVLATLAGQESTEDLLEAAQAALGRKIQYGGSAEAREPESAVREFPAGVLQRAAEAADAEEALEILAENVGSKGGRQLARKQCAELIEEAAARGNAELAMDVLEAMRANWTRGNTGRRLDWPVPHVSCHVALVRGLTAALRVQDAVEAVQRVRRCGLPVGEEVPFGKSVDCPTCRKPVAVVQPQHGCQLVACSRCRYQYELMSGEVVSCDSEALTSDVSFIERGLRVLRLKRRPMAAAVHSMVVRAPDGGARTHRFATENNDIPAQPGERVSVASAAPESAKKRTIGGLWTASTRVPGWRPGEAMALTNHVTGREAPLLRAPPKEALAAMGASWLLPATLLAASTDAASGLVDPTLPALLAVVAVSAAAVGGTANNFVLPRLNKLPQRSAEAVAGRQVLLEQHEKVERRLEDLSGAAASEVRMLARMWQLQNKMEAVGDPATYSSRLERVQRAREGLDERLTSRLTLIDSYAKIASMIEIEVEMGTDLLAAEAAGAAANIAEQITRLEEVDELQKEWRIQAEANDELERLLRNAPALPDGTL